MRKVIGRVMGAERYSERERSRNQQQYRQRPDIKAAKLHRHLNYTSVHAESGHGLARGPPAMLLRKDREQLQMGRTRSCACTQRRVPLEARGASSTRLPARSIPRTLARALPSHARAKRESLQVERPRPPRHFQIGTVAIRGADLAPEATKVVNDHFQGGQRKAPNFLGLSWMFSRIPRAAVPASVSAVYRARPFVAEKLLNLFFTLPYRPRKSGLHAQATRKCFPTLPPSWAGAIRT
jgi:hypothetical protein